MSLIETFLWPELKKLEPKSALGGVYANKPGYHNKRKNLPADDYSVREFTVDREGPSTEAGAIDWTFRDAQAGNYSTIAKYSKRLMAAGKSNDPRADYLREFFGNVDSDREVEGWDFTRNQPSTSDSSHLWHIHVSVHRKYVDDQKAMDALLSILKGETLSDYVTRTGHKPESGRVAAKPTAPPYPGTELHRNDHQSKADPNVAKAQAKLKQRGWSIKADGFFGPTTEAVVKQFQAQKHLTADGVIGSRTWVAIWTASVTSD